MRFFRSGNRNSLSSHLGATEGSIISKSYALRKPFKRPLARLNGVIGAKPQGPSAEREKLASPARIELATPSLGNLCSIQLSYGDTHSQRSTDELVGKLLRLSKGLAPGVFCHYLRVILDS